MPALVYVWVPAAVPEPEDSVTVPLEVVPSPQFHSAVCVSSVPGSVKPALAPTSLLAATGVGETVMSPIVGGRLFTLTWNVADPFSWSLSVTSTVTV